MHRYMYIVITELAIDIDRFMWFITDESLVVLIWPGWWKVITGHA